MVYMLQSSREHAPRPAVPRPHSQYLLHSTQTHAARKCPPYQPRSAPLVPHGGETLNTVRRSRRRRRRRAARGSRLRRPAVPAIPRSARGGLPRHAGRVRRRERAARGDVRASWLRGRRRPRGKPMLRSPTPETLRPYPVHSTRKPRTLPLHPAPFGAHIYFFSEIQISGPLRPLNPKPLPKPLSLNPELKTQNLKL